jgi:hypothetical protein
LAAIEELTGYSGLNSTLVYPYLVATTPPIRNECVEIAIAVEIT